MMELKNYMTMLKRHWLMLVSIPLIAMAATFIFMRFAPNGYLSKTQIITGLVDQTKQVMSNSDYDTQGKRNDAFTNLIETMQLDKVMSQVSYQLMVHDLTAKKPFREIKYRPDELSISMIKQMVAVLQRKLSNYELLDPTNAFEHRIDSMINVMGYDGGRLLKKNLKIFHFEGSDMINIECETEDPRLSAFMINSLSAKFITYYTNNVSTGRDRSLQFLSKLLNDKRTEMRTKIAQLQDYKVKHNILDMGDEAKSVYGQINSLASYRDQATKDVIAYGGALKSIDSRFDPKDRRYLESTTTKVNGAILATRERLRVLNNKYIENNFDPRYKHSIDSLQGMLNEQINESTDKYISNPLATKDNLVQEKLKMENQLELARYSSRSLDGQIATLKSRLNALVPAQAVVNSLERDIEVATKEYLDVQNKYDQAGVNSAIPVQLTQLHPALPGVMQPSKKYLLIALSGIGALVMCMVVVLILFYFDKRVHNSEDLARLTHIGVLGELNLIPEVSRKALRTQKNTHDRHISTFRDLLRNIRFEIDRRSADDKVIGVTSLNSKQGKTLFAISLAYAYAMTNKRVLLIDGNFSDPCITQTIDPDLYIEDLFRRQTTEHEEATLPLGSLRPQQFKLSLEQGGKTSLSTTITRLSQPSPAENQIMDRVNIIGNRGGDRSLLEIGDQDVIRHRFDQFKEQFDVVIIETGSLDTLSKAKEWIPYTDKVLAVFENGQTIADDNKSSLEYIKSLNGKMMGWVINKTRIGKKQQPVT